MLLFLIIVAIMSHNISRNQQQNAALMWIKFANTEKLKSGVKTALTKLKSNCHLKSSGTSPSHARSRASIHGISYRYIAGEPGALRPPIWPVAKLLPHVWDAVSVCARLEAGVSEIPAWSFLDPSTL